MANRGRNRRDQPGGWQEMALIWFVLFGVGGALILSYVAVRLGHRLAGLPPAPKDPWAILFGSLDGTVRWPPESFVVLGSEVAVLVAGAVLFWRFRGRGRKGTRVDWAATYLGHGKEIEGIGTKSVKATAERLGVRSRLPGVPIGKTVIGGHMLYGSWEDMHILIAGPRVGKSVCFAIPAILDAPGGALVTSNKRDLVDATRDPRSKLGPVWVFDPQQIAEEPPDWWWDPLSYVTDEVKAANLAQHFMSGSREADAKTDAFFDPAGRDLLAGLLLAAAVEGRQITEVYRWLTRPTDETPVDILRRAGYPLISDQVAGVVTAPEKQRGGVYGTAAQMASCLTSSQVLKWVTDETGHRRHFDPERFVREGGTLYSLSKEGRGTAGPLVTALTVAVVEAAEKIATGMPGGRLETPMVGVLDEAANVCKWKDLPDLYSHYGSRGIVLQTILQSWSQGEEVWGKGGMNKLWSASNVAIYGGGVKEEEFLERLAKLVGQYDKLSRSISSGGGGQTSLFSSNSSTSRQLNRERILDVDDLAAMPKGRAIVLSSGNRPTMIATVPWMAGPHADAVKASIKAHDPLSGRTLKEAEAGIAGWRPGMDDGPGYPDEYDTMRLRVQR